MSEAKPIEAEVVPARSQALAVRDTGGAVARALTVEQIGERLAFIRQVMAEQMKEGTDYGRIPGCGDKPTLLQPGAQKLLLTFQMREQVKRETLREFPTMPLHREYEFIVTVFPAGARPEDGWDGVGTCSTLEAKYRYRKSERKCPKCGHSTIIAENPKFLKSGQVAGWLCWKKKGGCGATFGKADPAITSQGEDAKTENENPADTWNTVRKMAFKRALVAAAINATNTSALWTQDLEDGGITDDAPEAPQKPPGAAGAASRPPAPPAPQNATATPKPATAPAKLATAATRNWMIAQLRATEPGPTRDFVTEFFQKTSVLMPNEALEDMPLAWVATSKEQIAALKTCLADFANGDMAAMPYKAQPEADAQKPTPPPAKPIEVPRDSTPPPQREDEWFFKVIVPIPHKGQKRDEYLANPDTIGSLYDACHDHTADSQAARQRLWGFVAHFQPKGWTKRSGEQMPPSDSDIKFREALDAFEAWRQKTHPDEKL